MIERAHGTVDLGGRRDSIRRYCLVAEYLDVPTLAARLHVSERFLWAEAKAWQQSGGARGLGPMVKLGRRVLFSATAVNAWLQRATVGSVPEDIRRG